MPSVAATPGKKRLKLGYCLYPFFLFSFFLGGGVSLQFRLNKLALASEKKCWGGEKTSRERSDT